MERRLRVLMVEGSEHDASLVADELRRGGYEPDCACVGSSDALKAALSEDHWEVVLADHSTPGLTPPDALRMVQACGKDVPFIVLYNTVGSGDAVEAMRLGAHDCIRKGDLSRLPLAIARELRDAADRHDRDEAERRLRESLETIRRIFLETVEMLATTLETRDPYTAGHQRRVASLAYAMANEMGLPRDEAEALRLAAAVHDIGKVHVPSEILTKPGRLAEEEFAIIKTHPRIGFDILNRVEFPWPIAAMVRQHHERLSGDGYPDRLSGDGILIGARIMAVADVVEAMASHRPYRPSLGLHKALCEVSKRRGEQFDADAVEACLRVFAKGYRLEGQEAQ